MHESTLVPQWAKCQLNFMMQGVQQHEEVMVGEESSLLTYGLIAGWTLIHNILMLLQSLPHAMLLST